VRVEEGPGGGLNIKQHPNPCYAWKALALTL
jgi:hypothetical protein